jgi:hypothetical protein
MISADPTLRQMAASNPALGAVLADPELMRRMMDPQNMQVGGGAEGVISYVTAVFIPLLFHDSQNNYFYTLCFFGNES